VGRPKKRRRWRAPKLIYTGIGSRQTPEPVLQLIRSLGRELAEHGWLLRSGGSPGADTAFEQGCDEAHGRKEIFLPWRGFNNSESPLFDTPAEALNIAARYHPRLRSSSWQTQQLRARNVCQVLGRSLDTPSDLVLAWTEDGLVAGGTATVLHIAAERGIPVINLGDAEYAGLAGDELLSRLLAFHHH
jgi:hypothetical protein